MANTDTEQERSLIAPTEIAEVEEGGVMTLREHLIELRNRIVFSAIGIAAGSAVGFWLADPILRYFNTLICVNAPSPAGVPQDCRLQIVDPAEGLLTYFRVALYVGIALGLPVVLYQLIRFMAPGLTRMEKRVLYWSLPCVAALFVGGSAFAVRLVIPAMLQFLAGFAPDIFKADLRATGVLSLTLSITLWMGIVFEMPLAMVLLTRFRVLDWRKLLSWWRYAIVIILIVAAIITPTPDPFNMMIVAGPMMILYALGVGLARVFRVKPLADVPTALAA